MKKMQDEAMEYFKTNFLKDLGEGSLFLAFLLLILLVAITSIILLVNFPVLVGIPLFFVAATLLGAMLRRTR